MVNPDGAQHHYALEGGEMIPLEPVHNPAYVAPADLVETLAADLAYLIQMFSYASTTLTDLPVGEFACFSVSHNSLSASFSVHYQPKLATSNESERHGTTCARIAQRQTSLPLRHLHRRHDLSGDGHVRGRHPRARRRPGRLPAGADLLRPAGF